ncbi:hypothetical protein AB4Z48_39635 [Cupriavidus sp. 2TAF22]|uniref:hypothetical protein n=1 Tax=unclassified Cupriavidus TaxID=2640874 RepID=UPI003F932B0D
MPSPRIAIRLLPAFLMLVASHAFALAFECRILNESNRPFVRIVLGTTESQANSSFISAYGNQVRRMYGPGVRFLCSYPPSKEALASVPGTNTPYKACPSGKTWAKTRGDALEVLQHECGPPLPLDHQMFFASFWAQAREKCRFAMANEHVVVALQAPTMATNLTLEYVPLWKEAEAVINAEGCSPATRGLAEAFARYLTRTGDPNGERPFVATCLQREGMNAAKCRCYGDAVRLIDPKVFEHVYDGRSYGDVVRQIGPLWEGQLTMFCLGVRPN